MQNLMYRICSSLQFTLLTLDFLLNFRYIYLLVGGVILACTSVGPYAALLLIPALGSGVLCYTVHYHAVHRWAFLLQMGWQTCCHLWIMYKQYYLQEIMTIKFSIMISSLMLLTQKVTSLAMDLHERKVTLIAEDCIKEKGFHDKPVYGILSLLSYLMSFPALLGGPLCSFVEFQHQVANSHRCSNMWQAWVAIRGCTLFLLCQIVHGFLSEKIDFQCDLMDCRQLHCVYVMWTTALLYKLTYYSHWILDEALFLSAGFSVVMDSDINIYTLETTNKISVFARTWNKSTAKWLRRLIFQNCRKSPLFATFAFSAWWHGLYPGQIFGFLCWAVMVEADYRIHMNIGTNSTSWYIIVFHKAITWILTQLIIAFIMLAIEMRSVTMIYALCFSYNSLFPIIYCMSLIFFIKRKR
ncbi:ghrelin O-acyltransferase [Pseudophryne corroboree]|uniref:ghrelin O-acyltransferase n=1 Tax=Pseudophryne corroboree TaxID=495146 RepID=UPI003081EA82